MRPGEVQRLYCDNCLHEFEVILEPKVREGMGAGSIPPAAVKHCPFCGEEIEEEAE